MRLFLLLVPAFALYFFACQVTHGDQTEDSENDPIQDSFIYQGLTDTANPWDREAFEKRVSKLEDKGREEWQQSEKLLDWMKFKQSDRVLDIGCGTGYFSFPLSERVFEVYCADIDPRFLEFVEKKKDSLGSTNLHTVLFDKEIPNKNLSVLFDRVVTVNTYHHLYNRSLYFSHVLEMMKPGGKLYIVDFKPGDLPLGPSKEHKIPAAEVMRELLLSGFDQVVEVDSVLPYQYIVIAGKKQ